MSTFLANCHRAIAAKLFAVDKWRVGQGAMMGYLREFQKTQFATLEETRARQLRELRKIVQHAIDNCPFYAQRFSNLDLSVSSLSSLEELAAFPVLEKRDIQQHKDQLVAANWPKTDLIANHTGGSTGEPLPLYYNLDRRCQRDAGAWRHNSWAGARLGDKVAYIWGAAFDLPSNTAKERLRNLLVDRSLYLNSGELTEQNIVRFHESLKRFRPTTIIAYAKSIALVARYLKDRGLAAYQPQGIITSAETLSDEDRMLVEEVFGAKIFNRYGCREVSIIASECEQHDGLHTMGECLIVEVVDAQGAPVAPGETGSIVVTDLFNYAMPLIRYRIGDVGALRSEPCPCGRGLPMLERVEGRVTDFLVGSDGRLVSGVYVGTYLIGKCPGLGQVQVLQERPGELFYKVTNPPSDADIEFVRDTSEKMLGANVKVDIEYVESIPRSRSGKLLLCRSTATTDFMQTTGSSAGVSE